VSGTIDELIRHSTSNESSILFLMMQHESDCTNGRNRRLFFVIALQMWIYVFRQPTQLANGQTYYEIPFKKNMVVLFHPVTTEVKKCKPMPIIL
jgi:hypothetical protein